MANSETWFIEGAAYSGIDGRVFPNREAAETEARTALEGGTSGPLTIVQVVRTEVCRLEKTTTITETDLTA